MKGLCNFPYKRIENEQNEKRAVLNMFLLPGYEMFQPLQTFRNTLFKMIILNNSVLYQFSNTKKQMKKQFKTHRGHRKIRLKGSLRTRL